MADRTITLNVAADTIKLRNLRKELEEIENDLKTVNDPKAFLALNKAAEELNKQMIDLNKSTKGVGASFEDVYGDAKPLTAQLGEMEDRMYQLALAGQQNSQEFKDLQVEVVRYKQTLMETDKAVDALADNKGFSFVAAGLGEIGSSLASLDFETAAKQSAALQDRISKISPEAVKKQMDSLNDTFKNLGAISGQAISGLVKNVGSMAKTFMSFGKALLMNPIFLIAAAIALIVAAIVALLSKLGVLKPIMDAIGKVFKFFGDIIDAVVQGLKDFLDWLGLTNNAEIDGAQRAADAAKKKADANDKYVERALIGIDAEIEKAKIQGKNTEDLERKRVYMIAYKAKLQAEAAKKELIAAQKKGDLDEEELQALKDKVYETQNYYIETKKAGEIFEVQAAQTRKENREKNKKEADEAAKEAADEAKANAKEAADRAKQYAADRLATERQIEDIRLSILEDGTEKEIKLSEVRFKRLKEDALKNDKLVASEREELLKLYESQSLAATKKIRDDAAKKESEELFKKNKEITDALAELALTVEEIENEQLNRTLAQQDVEKNAVRDKYFAIIEAAKQAGLDITNLELAQQAELDAIDADYKAKKAEEEKKLLEERLNRNADTLAGQKALLDYQMQQELANKNLTEEEKKKIEDKYRKQTATANIAAVNIALEATKQGLNAVQGLSDAIFANKMSKLEKGSAAEEKAAKKQFEINKKLQIAQAVVQGIQAVLAAYSSGSAIPVVGAVTGPLFAGLAAITVAANVAKIKNSKFEGGGGTADTGSAAAGSAAAATPSFNLFGSGNQNNVAAAEDRDTTQNIVIQNEVKVSESEITGTQQTVKNIKESSVL